MSSPTIRIHPRDNVVIARTQLLGGTAIGSEGITVAGLVPPGHKIATRPIAQGEAVRRYDQIIGHATQAIAPGQHVHTHNCAYAEFARTHEPGAGAAPTAHANPPVTFDGIVRSDGRIATRNYIGVLTSVNCSATAARAIADQFRRDIRPEMPWPPFPNVDGIVALTHGMGCATASDGEELLCAAPHARWLRASIANFAAVLDRRPGLRDQPDPGPGGAGRPGRKARTFEDLQHPGHGRHRQDGGAWRRADQADVALRQPACKRVSVPASHLTVGLQCGGSDGYSAASAPTPL